MALTFGQLRAEALGWLDESSATVADQSYANVDAALKESHTRRLVEDNWKFMLYPKTHTLTTVANQQTYSLHQEFLRPYWFRNTTSRVWLIETPSRNIAPDGIDSFNDRDTLRFQLAGRSQVYAQPSSASVVTMVSSSASDTTAAKAITVRGDTTDGVRSESLTPNGTTPVVGTVSFTHILSISKAAAWVGTATLTSNAAAVTVLKLFATEYGRSYQQLELLYLPTAGETISYRFYRKPSDFGATDGDVPDLPPPFERLVLYDALLMMAAYDNRLEGGRMNLWFSLRDDLDREMRTVFQEGQSIEAEPRFIRDRLEPTVHNMRMGS